MKAKYGIATTCEWIGNTIAVAQEHYLWAAEHDFVEANGSLIETEAGQLDAPGVHKAQINGMRQECTPDVAADSRLLQIVKKPWKSAIPSHPWQRSANPGK